MTSAVTKIPTETDVAVVPTGSPTTLLLFSVTPETIRQCDKYRGLKVTDIHDKAQLKAVHDARMIMVGYRTTCKKEHKAAREDAIREQKRVLASENALVAMIAEIEGPLEAEENRVQAAIEAERVAKKKALHDSRKAQLIEAVGEFTEILGMWPADLSDAGVAEFDAMLVMAGVHATGKRQLAEAARIAKEQADQALAEQQERDRLAEVERVRQRAIEDENRKAAQAELDAKMAAFEKQKAEAAELQRKADEAREARIAQENADRLEREAVRRAEDQAKLDAQTAELNRQRSEIAAEQQKIRDAEAKLAEEQRIAVERATYSERVASLLAVGATGKHVVDQTRMEQLVAMTQPEFDATVRRATEDAEYMNRVDARSEETAIEIARLMGITGVTSVSVFEPPTESDTELMAAWITAVENFADEQFPSVSPTCEGLLTELHRDLSGCIDAMRGRLT